MRKSGSAALAVLSASLLGAAWPQPSMRDPAARSPARSDGTLSVLTYNVHGLPWPVAWGRPANLDTIGEQLAELRRAGRAPDVIVLQEAFTDEARRIGVAAGYRFIANGPSASDIGLGPTTAADRSFAAGARWWRGETEGKRLGSGLQLLSDHPIVTAKRIAFPSFACAGFDCLANKGALLATLSLPTGRLDVLTTHLNSRTASHAPDARSIDAFERQVAALTTFVRTSHDPALPLVAAGDFNVGPRPARRTALAAAVETWSGTAQPRDALRSWAAVGGRLGTDAAYSLRRGRDFEFFFDGEVTRLAIDGIFVPFGHDRWGRMLSDHVGYMARFRITPVAAADALTSRAATTRRRSAA